MSPTLLPGVDRAAFAVAFERALRDVGVAVSLSATADLVAAFRHRFPRTRDELYWLARITMVSTRAEVGTFDEVFASVFDDSVVRLDPIARRNPPAAPPEEPSDPAVELADDPTEASGSTLPWVLPREVSIGDDDLEQSERRVPELRASAARAGSELPFGELTDADMDRLAGWVQDASGWPMRMSRRTRRDGRGRRVAMRHTLAAARRTGYEPLSLVRESRRRRPRRIVMVCDVSQSMQAVAAAHLHLMRALARHRRAEVFAFSTELTRLTPSLRATTPLETLEVAADQLDDRLGGTRIAASLRTLLDSHHGGLLRGAVVMIASDGWDSDDPAEMARVMRRIERRAHAVVWLNPRAAAPGFTPAAGALLAALPHCRLMLPAGSFADLREAIVAVRAAADRGTVTRRSALTSTG
ncbi:VWA domain-containing protein [Nostocoides sp. F2B08]|uniref:vWA domain-containing protein n=1 Tax=Nostocoides sp. F2B08 TaxID=2653936 RepID=UPI0012630A0C|nr:VWA domain-containing protein [Tetrasphaera sp. F2B08]KAB7746300.1 VWA domain-containing protein [Tetrasphaera sp. F2B08]